MSEDSIPSKRMVPEQEVPELSDAMIALLGERDKLRDRTAKLFDQRSQLRQEADEMMRLAAAKDAEIAALTDAVEYHSLDAARLLTECNALTEQRDILTDRLEELVAFSEQRDQAMKLHELFQRSTMGTILDHDTKADTRAIGLWFQTPEDAAAFLREITYTAEDIAAADAKAGEIYRALHGLDAEAAAETEGN